jgi:hypothetical protein
MSSIPNIKSPHLSAAYRKERTWNNFRPDVIKSGLQKYVRRGATEKALFCAGELDLFKYAEDGRAEGIRTNFIHRMMIIYLEDIGTANLALWPILDAQVFALLAARRKDAAKEVELISQMVREMCASEKSRSCSHLRATTFVQDATTRAVLATESAEFPTVAAIHAEWADAAAAAAATATFDDLCRGFESALERRSWTAITWGTLVAGAEGVKVSEYRKKKPVWRVFRILERALPAELRPLHAVAMRWYSELEGLKEAMFCWLLLVVACVQGVALGTAEAIHAIETEWSRNLRGDVIELDSFVEDRHTAAGRGKSLTEFALVGAHVENESTCVIQEFKRFYERVKKAQDATAGPKTPPKANPVPATAPAPPAAETTAVPKESEAYEFIVRAQINTTAGKADVYFATATNTATRDFVVVKGPLAAKDDAIRMLEVQEWKRRHGLPHVEAKVVELIADRWPEGIPLGLRNRIDRNKPAAFLVSKAVVEESALKRKTHSSKLWPPTEVAEWSAATPLHFDAAKATFAQMKAYIQALLVRYVFGISDLADRNFLLAKGTVISVDEEYRDHPVDFPKELKKNRCAKVREWLERNYEELGVGTWEFAEPKYAERAAAIQTKESCCALFRCS